MTPERDKDIRSALAMLDDRSSVDVVIELRALVQRAEWAAERDGDIACPWCHEYIDPRQTHAATCPAALALGWTRAEA